jgi:UDPglucose 6-dehydrogenase
VLGLWHLGVVTSACLAQGGHDVTGLDFDASVVDGLARGKPPLFEPGLEDLVTSGLAAGRLRFTTDAAQAIESADVVWVAYDTPVDDEDRADAGYVIERVTRVFPHVREGALLLISSQLPAGTTRNLARSFAAGSYGRRVGFGYSPENLRLGRAIEAFTRPDRVVAGVCDEADRGKVSELLRPFGPKIEWMSVESAEMTKHALNAFLATSVAFINEVAALCEQVGADATDVARGLKSEPRIGPKAYLSPGPAFAGGTLARDVVFLSQLGMARGVPTQLLSSVKSSNDAHQQWTGRRLEQLLPDLRGRTVGVWGLTYKPGTDTLRRSASIELCEWLSDRGAIVRAHDPAVRSLPASLAARVELAGSAPGAVQGASALVVATPWPEYKEISSAELKGRMVRALVLDPGRFLKDTLGADPDVEYVSVGTATAHTGT